MQKIKAAIAAFMIFRVQIMDLIIGLPASRFSFFAWLFAQFGEYVPPTHQTHQPIHAGFDHQHLVTSALQPHGGYAHPNFAGLALNQWFQQFLLVLSLIHI